MTAARAPIDEARLRKLWRKGLNAREIGAAMGCCHATVYKYMKAMKLPLRRTSEPKLTSKPKPDPKPAPPALQDRPDYPRIVAAVQRGVKPMCLAAWFGLPYRDAREVRP